MMTGLTSLSNDLAALVDRAAASVVQVHGRRRPAAGVVFADGLVLTTALLDEDRASVQGPDGHAREGVVLGPVPGMGLTIVKVEGLSAPPLPAAAEPRPGHLAVAIGRTWSGGVMAALAPVAVVGGPLRTGRASTIERVIRIQQPPHGALSGGALVNLAGEALGIITATAIRGTALVIPASIAWPVAARGAAEGGARQGFLGVSSMAVAIPERQRAGRPQPFGLLVSHVAAGSPADEGGILVGDLIVAFDGHAVRDPEELLARLRGNRVGSATPITVIRGAAAQDLTVTVGERPRG